jgi:hypothetical protein
MKLVRKTEFLRRVSPLIFDHSFEKLGFLIGVLR